MQDKLSPAKNWTSEELNYGLRLLVALCGTTGTRYLRSGRRLSRHLGWFWAYLKDQPQLLLTATPLIRTYNDDKERGRVIRMFGRSVERWFHPWITEFRRRKSVIPNLQFQVLWERGIHRPR